LIRSGPPARVKGPEITHADRCTLVFDTDSKSLYVEREVAHLGANVGGAVDYQTETMDIADYFKQSSQTAGRRKLWRLQRSLFKEDSKPRRGDGVRSGLTSCAIHRIGHSHVSRETTLLASRKNSPR
jgi:hypothetical protein